MSNILPHEPFIPPCGEVNNISFYFNRIFQKMEDMHKDIQEIKAKLDTINITTTNINNTNKTTINDQQQHIQQQTSYTPSTDLYPAVLHINPKCSSEISSLFVLQDKRLAMGSLDQSITICSIDVENRSYTIDIKKEKAHDNEINSICQFGDRDDILVSSSDDNTIKIWQLFQYEMKFIRVFDKHSDYVFKVIPLTNMRCASCSYDRTVKIWRASIDDASTELASLSMRNEVRTILQLRSGNEELVASCRDETIWFWNVNNDTYTHVHTITGYYAFEPYHMIELPEMKLAVSSDTEEHPLVIIDTQRYEIVKVIEMRNYNVHNISSLCMLNNTSFIYARDTTLIRFDAHSYEVIHHINTLDEVGGDWDIVAFEDGAYFAIGNVSKGVTVFKNVSA